ncbi:hypothetical protein NQ317_007429 [Molorchus minor]|uniref:Double jelly roll-like domain-containing protein n=1 Tax=Molorchus minor TaxID=1323400 RepID=A0ABQ9JHT2_9CUCU|nr:hypothetical protein NQ317_007429 [Molorchus minor]
MLEELQIFQDPEFDDSIIREEIRTYHPFVKSFANNDEIEIVIYQQDALLLMSEAALVIEGTLVKTNGSTGDIQFTTNCGAYLFDSITYELNGKEVDKVRDPGTVSTIRGYLCYNKNDETLNAAGWNYPESQLVTYDPLKSTFFLARNDRNCFQVSKDDTDGMLTITNIELKVKHVFLNDVLKLKLLTEINKDKPILIPYRQWEYHELPSLTNGTSKEIWSIKTCTNLESPRYVIVAFQTNLKDNKSEDITYFNNLNISNIKLNINSEYYPYEDMKLDFDARKYADAYYMYTQFYKSFASDNNYPILDFIAFKSRTLFVIDCSKRNDAIKTSTIDIKLEIESRKSFPANTKAYCIVIHDRILESLPLSGLVRGAI